MGFSIFSDRVRFRPTLTCDECGEIITDWGMAMVMPSKPTAEEAHLPVRVFHKGKCDPGDSHGWLELSSYVPWLLYNHQWGEVKNGPDGNPEAILVPLKHR